MAIVDKEYTFSVNRYNQPVTLTDKNAIGTRLMTLIMMEPG